MTRRGLTLIEVLVAGAVLAVASAAVAGLLLGGVRLQAQAARRAAWTESLAPWLVPGARPHVRLPSCPEAPGDVTDAEDAVSPARAALPVGDPSPCVVAWQRCRLTATAVACDGIGELVRVDLDVRDGDGAPWWPGADPVRIWDAVR